MRLFFTLVLATLFSLGTAQAQDSAVIKANDKLEIKVAGEDDMTSALTVGSDGSVNVTFIGRMRVSGMNVDDAAASIRASLIKKRYFVDPQVSINITSAAKRFFTVIGQVNKGDTFEFPDDGKMDLLAAIGRAQGFSKIANPSKVTVKRAKGGRELYDTKKLTTPVPINPGDVIEVAESRF